MRASGLRAVDCLDLQLLQLGRSSTKAAIVRIWRRKRLAADSEFFNTKYTDVFTNASMGWPAVTSLYRAYVLEEAGRIRQAIELDCANDAAALEEARQYVDGHDVELCGHALTGEPGQLDAGVHLSQPPLRAGRFLIGI
jgi:hypothetical protein